MVLIILQTQWHAIDVYVVFAVLLWHFKRILSWRDWQTYEAAVRQMNTVKLLYDNLIRLDITKINTTC